MRKDFLVDPYQVLEARAAGAGGVLLIVRMVARERLVAMLDCAAEQGLFVLLEAFDADDLEVAAETRRASARGRDEQVLMGLNCRDLETLADRLRALRASCASDCRASGPRSPRAASSRADGCCARRALGYRLALVGTSADAARPIPQQAVARAARGRPRRPCAERHVPRCGSRSAACERARRVDGRGRTPARMRSASCSTRPRRAICRSSRASRARSGGAGRASSGSRCSCIRRRR